MLDSMAKRFLAPAWCGGLAVGVPSLYTPRSHASTSSCPGCGALGIRNWISKEERNALGKRVNSGCVSKPIYWGARGVTLFIAICAGGTGPVEKSQLGCVLLWSGGLGATLQGSGLCPMLTASCL